MIKKNHLFNLIFLCFISTIITPLKACDQSNLTLTSYTDNGATHDYTVQLCIGGGITGLNKGADNNTTSFGLGLYKQGATLSITNFTPSLTSTETGVTNTASMQGAQPQSPFFCEEFLFFQQSSATPFVCVNSTAQCGMLHSDCFSISFTSNVALDSILAFAVEGTGNPSAGCYQETYMVINMATALPVELSFFEGQVLESDIVLQWETLSELNNAYFEIERSVNLDFFESIGKVEGQGTTLERTSYEFKDQPTENGRYYYRLKQVDIDGSIQYSAIITVDFLRNTIKTTVFPNPVEGILNLQFDKLVSATIVIYNALGQVITNQTIDNQYFIELNTAELPKGIYYISMQGKDFNYQKQFIKK